MTQFDPFDNNARANGILVDTNLLVLLVVGAVNRDRIPSFKRTSKYTAEDWDLLTGILEQIKKQFTLPHVLSEVSALTDLGGAEMEIARITLQRSISLMRELTILSSDVCASPLYLRFGLTDAAIGTAAKQQHCSVLTNDSRLQAALSSDGASAALFDDLRKFL